MTQLNREAITGAYDAPNDNQKKAQEKEPAKKASAKEVTKEPA